MQKLQTVNAETLLYEPLEKPSFVVDSLIPTGLSLFCGSQKIGKSWLMLKLCLCVSQENLFATMESEEATPSLSQAQRMKQLSQSGRLDMDTIFAIMTEEKGNQKETLKINTSKLKKYFPKDRKSVV